MLTLLLPNILSAHSVVGATPTRITTIRNHHIPFIQGKEASLSIMLLFLLVQ